MPGSDGFDDDDGTTRASAVSDLHRQRVTNAVVEVISGPDVGKRVPIGQAAVVGSGEGCDLRLRDDLVSRHHLELRADAHAVHVRDLGSRNGTFFSGARLKEVALTESAVFVLGSTSLRVTIETKPHELILHPHPTFGRAIGPSPAMRAVFALLAQAARTNVTVLLEGDSGTGKDVLAESIHVESPRREGPFVVLDCGAIPETLIESELFGHEKGAFTGAQSARDGAFIQADGGTLFLDEIGELPLDMQPKLLRALESRTVRRVGASKPTPPLDVRVVAATNRKLADMAAQRTFREDLFFRLAVIHIRVPRLAERLEDVAPLAELFFRRATGVADAHLPPEIGRLLSAYDWPGNARELRNVVERFATFERADPALLFGVRSTAAQATEQSLYAELATLPYREAKQRLVEAFHRGFLPLVLERAGGSVARAAELLEMPRTSLYRMLKEISITSDDGGD
jgi:transcriptional regulator with PAS, ATPase and Fis domain